MTTAHERALRLGQADDGRLETVDAGPMALVTHSVGFFVGDIPIERLPPWPIRPLP